MSLTSPCGTGVQHLKSLTLRRAGTSLGGISTLSSDEQPRGLRRALQVHCLAHFSTWSPSCHMSPFYDGQQHEDCPSQQVAGEGPGLTQVV